MEFKHILIVKYIEILKPDNVNTVSSRKNAMHKTLIVISIVAISVFFVGRDYFITPPKPSQNGSQQHAHVSKRMAPNVTFTGLDGTTYELHAFEGKTILLNFWATWCPPCIIEMPELLKLAEREKENLVLIALSVDEKPEKIDAFLEGLPAEIQNKLQLDNVIFGLDTDKEISQEYGTDMYPETYIIKDDMMIHRKIEGITDWLGEDIKAIISK